MTSDEIRKRFISFFEKRGHALIPSSSLVPENDPSVLFNTAGMQPLVPYLLGQKHPLGNRLVNIQKCLRTSDIDDVGDNIHLTFFEMMGNWSLGGPSSQDGIGRAGYFKEEAIEWSYELLTSREEGFGLDPKRLYISVFEGDESAPRDEEAAEIWKKYVPENRIYYRSADKNWWTPGPNGPAGPDTEMFYDVSVEGIGDLTSEEFEALDKNNDQRIIEIWNDVFMQYEQKDGKVISKLKQKNVDTGSGFERMAVVLQKKMNVYETDLFVPILEKINELVSDEITDSESDLGSGRGLAESDLNLEAQRIKSCRIIADHMRASVFLIADGITPQNKDQGYVLRRLIRRSVRFADKLGMKHGSLFWIADTIIEKYQEAYPSLSQKKGDIKKVIDEEEQKFRKTLNEGIDTLKKKFFNRAIGGIDPDNLPPGSQIKGNKLRVDGREVFNVYQSFGLPIEISQEIMKDWGIEFDEQTIKEANEALQKHQELSRSGSEQKFKGGLGGTGVMETRYHTATHLLNAALREVLGNHVMQKGSNITAERMRFDFSHPQKMTDEEKQKVEDLVNQKIKQGLNVSFEEMPIDEAEKSGAVHAFGDKYGDIVRVYTIADPAQPHGYFSREFCGGPHVENTKELGHFKIVKEEAVSSGVRRIKAVLE